MCFGVPNQPFHHKACSIKRGEVLVLPVCYCGDIQIKCLDLRICWCQNIYHIQPNQCKVQYVNLLGQIQYVKLLVATTQVPAHCLFLCSHMKMMQIE